MNRIIIPTNSIGTSAVINNIQQNTLLGLADVWESIFGQSSIVWGLGCAPTSPASLAVTIARGGITQLTQVDASAPGSGDVNSNTVVKEGSTQGPTTITFTAPVVTGYSQNFLVEVAFNETDTNPQVLDYVDPSTGNRYTGNTAVNTSRSETCAIQIKAGTPALAGSQTTPPVDAGWVGLYSVTINEGQTQITANSITKLSGVPWASNYFITPAELEGVYALETWVYANFPSLANTTTAATASTVALRDSTGSLTAVAFHGNADTASFAQTANVSTFANTALVAGTATNANSAAFATLAGVAAISNSSLLASVANFANSSALATTSTNLNGYVQDVNATSSTIVLRDGGGNINCVKMNGEALEADYADLAENYVGDIAYVPGTVLQLGGAEDVTAAVHEVFGVVSENPAYRMDTALTGANVVPVAMVGKVPVRIIGAAKKHDFLILSAIPGVAIAVTERPLGKKIIGRTLEEKTSATIDTVLSVVQVRI